MRVLTGPAAEARTAWQPIETAPLWKPADPRPPYVMGLHGDRTKPPTAVLQTAPGHFSDEYGNRIRGLTHWQPLPAAPEAP